MKTRLKSIIAFLNYYSFIYEIVIDEFFFVLCEQYKRRSKQQKLKCVAKAQVDSIALMISSPLCEGVGLLAQTLRLVILFALTVLSYEVYIGGRKRNSLNRDERL